MRVCMLILIVLMAACTMAQDDDGPITGIWIDGVFYECPQEQMPTPLDAMVNCVDGYEWVEGNVAGPDNTPQPEQTPTQEAALPVPTMTHFEHILWKILELMQRNQ